MSLVKITVDPGNVLARQFTELERSQLPFAAMQAANQTADSIRRRWIGVMPRVFDRPTPLTLNAVLYRKANKTNPFAEIFIRNEAFKGAPPEKYLKAEVEGGVRRHKAFEKRLIAAGIMGPSEYAVPGAGAKLDAYGNMPGSEINRILSQVGARFDPLQNETSASRDRRKRKEARAGSRRGDYVAIRVQRGGLKPGIYQRVSTGAGRGVTPILAFVKAPTYRPRFNIYELAEAVYRQEYPFQFERELAKAVQSTQIRRGLL